MGKYRVVVIVAVVVVFALIGGGLFLKSHRNDESVLSDENDAMLDTEEDDPAADIVVTLEEFGDYQSQSCAKLNPTLKKLKEEYGPNLNVVFRNLPVISINKNALLAAQAAEAARMQSRFWEMHDLLYEKQNEWKDEENPRPKFLQFAGDLGIDVARFRSDIDSEQVRFRIEADKDAAVAQGIQEIPAIVINGRRLKTEAMTADGIREGIEVMLTRGSEESPDQSP
jgi:protein-disulfide isomerase